MGLTTTVSGGSLVEWVAAVGSVGAIVAVMVSHKIQATSRPDLHGEVHRRGDHIIISNSGADAYRLEFEYSVIKESPVEPLRTGLAILNKGDSILIAVGLLTPLYGASPIPRITIRYYQSPRWYSRRRTKIIDLIDWAVR